MNEAVSPKQIQPDKSQRQCNNYMLGSLNSAKFTDIVEGSTIDKSYSGEQKLQRILNFKDFRGFKNVQNIKERYKIGRVLGEGSFGQVRIALHR